MGVVVGRADTERAGEHRRWGPLDEAVLGLVPAAGVAAGTVVGLAVDAEATVDGLVARLVLFAVVAAVAFGVLGWLLGRRQPGHALARLATAMGWCFAASVLLERYATLGHPRGWPGVTWALWIGQWSFVPAMWAIPTLLVLRFPTGGLPTPRWRVVERAAAVGIAVGTVGWALARYGEVDVAPVVPLENPVASDLSAPLFWIGLALWAGAAVASLAGFGHRALHARGVERAQLRWVVLGTLATVALVAVGAQTGQELVSCLGIAVLPASIGVAMLRHGLWDIDLVLHRSLVYGMLTALILAVYSGTVWLLGGVLGRSVGAPLLATAMVAVGVQPARQRMQRVVSRLLYGEREDPYAALARLGEQLDAVADRSNLLLRITEAVVRTMRLRGARLMAGDAVLAAVGDLGERRFVVPLVVGGQEVGTLHVGVADGDALTRSDEQLLRDLARHVAAAVRAEHLQSELEASRARLVTAREEERRRIRRDLHDELGPTLAAIAIDIERSGLEVREAPDAAAARLEAVAAEVRSTVRSVRALVEGLRPAALDELGLEGAIHELVRSLGRGPVAVVVDVPEPLGALPAAVDVAAYRIVGEALTNVVRHAGARRCRVALVRTDAGLEVVVEDDGRGVGAAPAGVGRRSMRDRAEELGGTFDLAAGPDGGVVVRAVLPLPA